MGYDYIKPTSESDTSKGISSLKTPTNREIADRLNKSNSRGGSSKSSSSKKKTIEIGIIDNKIVQPTSSTVIKRGGKNIVQSTFKTDGKTVMSEGGKIVFLKDKNSGLSYRFSRSSNIPLNFFNVNPQSIDPKKLISRTTKLVKDNRGNVWGYYDRNTRRSIGFTNPISANQIYRLEQSRQPQLKQIGKVTPAGIRIEGATYKPRTDKEREFLLYLKDVIIKKDGWDKEFLEDMQKRNLTQNISDKWYQKALKGAGRGFADLKNLPKTTAKFIMWTKTEVLKEKAIKSLKDSGQDIAVAQFRGGLKSERQKRAKQVIPTVITGVKSFNPIKPENWFNIATFVVTSPASVKPVKNTISKFKKNYLPSTRNTNTFKSLVTKQLKVIKKAKTLVQSEIKSGRDVALNKVLLNRIIKTEKTLNKGYSLVEKALKNPNVLKLSDFNPLVRSSELLKQFGQRKYVYHATAFKVNKLFGQKFKVVKPLEEILKKVKSASGKARIKVSSRNIIENKLLSIIKKEKGVISGGKAQNLFVKKSLRRKTVDYDVLVKNHRSVAYNTLKQLRISFPRDFFKLKILSPPALKGKKVYRIIANRKDLVDFDPLPKDLGKPVKVGSQLVASPEFLARRKKSTIGDLSKVYREVKDTKDLQRLTGRLWNDKKLFKVVKDAPDTLTIRSKPKNMGVDRIKFGEDQFFWDLEVATDYAYNALGRKSLTQRAINTLSKIKLPKGFKSPGVTIKNSLVSNFVNKINKYKFIKSNSRITVIRMESKISGLPKSLSSRVKKASSLSKSAQDVLRRDIVKYLKSSGGYNKVLGGSRTLSKGFGEREFVTGAGSKLFKQNLKKSFDKETNTFIDVVEVAFKRSNKASLLSSSSTQGSNLNRLRLASISSLKSNFFTPADFLKVKKFQRALVRAEALGAGDYNDIVTITLKMLRSKKASKGFSALKNKESKILNTLREANRKKVITMRKPSIRKAALSVRTAFKPRSATRIKTRATSRARKTTRTPSRTASRVRTPSRKTTRTPSRTASRVRTPSRARTPVRTRTPGLPARTTSKLRKIRGSSLKRKRTKFTKDEIKYMLSKVYVKGKYRPSLAALVYNITGFKAPKSLTGFEIRPVIKRGKK